MVSVDDLLQYAQHFNCQTIITCGHSLGGAVSSIVALDLTERLKERNDFTVKAFNITFGAPSFGNRDVLKMCKETEMDKNIVNYTNVKDIVPGLLNLEHTFKVLRSDKIDLSSLSSTQRTVIKQALSKPKLSYTLLSIASYLPFGPGLTKDEIEKLNPLFEELQREIEPRKLGN